MTDTNKSSNQSPSDDVADELANVKRRRKARRSICTKNITNLNNILVLNDKDTAAIRSVIDSLQSGMTEMIKYDNILQDHMDEDALLKDMEECDARIEAIKTAIYKAQDHLDSVKTSSNIESEVKTSELYKPMQKKLPIFEGDILQFQHFIEMFESAVGNKNYDPVNKLEALFDCLKGQAKRLLSGYSLTGENYEIVLNLLKSDYGNNAKVVETLILNIVDLAATKCNYFELQSFKANMHCFVESLSTREKIKECISCSTILGTILARKLLQEIKDKIPWEKLREKWTINYVIELVNQALFALEALGEHLNKPVTPKSDPKKGAFPKSQFRNILKPTTTLYTTENDTSNSSYPSSIRCRFCKEEHYPSDCPSVDTISDRKQFCVNNHWCENCFSRDHQGSQCDVAIHCRTYKEETTSYYFLSCSYLKSEWQ